jgi:hypothetical protein
LHKQAHHHKPSARTLPFQPTAEKHHPTYFGEKFGENQFVWGLKKMIFRFLLSPSSCKTRTIPQHKILVRFPSRNALYFHFPNTCVKLLIEFNRFYLEYKLA